MPLRKPLYSRLSDEDREEISRCLAEGLSQADIARDLERSPSTISRELRRGSQAGEYRAVLAGKRAKRRATSRKLGKRKMFMNVPLRAFVHRHLLLEWSPEQIVSELRLMYPDNQSMRVSSETIYEYIYVLPRGSLKHSLIQGLRQERKYRRKQRKGKLSETRGKMADMLSIEERPKEVAERTVPGHWEGDLILGRHKQSAIGTLVERVTRYTLIVRLARKDAGSVRRAFARKLRRLPREFTRSLTYDQGKEMSEHVRFTMETDMKVFFAHPSSPWERGTNENTNGLIRQYFPKGTDFRKVSAADLRRVQDRLNGRPRKVLDFRKPVEAFNELVALNS